MSGLSALTMSGLTRTLVSNSSAEPTKMSFTSFTMLFGVSNAFGFECAQVSHAFVAVYMFSSILCTGFEGFYGLVSFANRK